MATPIFEANTRSFAAEGLQVANRNLLRFTTAGSVDDGKSTLIGRLLYDSQAVYEDQLASVKKSRINRSAGPVDFSLLTDGLRAEREQGITIDVAYRYFSTPRRKFIIADTPGHEQYTRNMATGASTADAAIVLLDATRGVLPQSRRHAYIARLLGIQHVVAAINKMDLVSYSQEVFDLIAAEFRTIAEKLGLFSIYVVPVSALEGDNIVRRSSRMEWFEGAPLLQHLEELPNQPDGSRATRFPVQYVIRPDQTFRGFAGQLASGKLSVGERVLALPSGVRSRVKTITTFDGELQEASAGEAITLTLEDEVDISRGDMLVTDDKPPAISQRLQSRLIWMHPVPLDLAKRYILKHSTRSVRARVARVRHRIDVNTFSETPANSVAMNDIVSVEIETTLPLFFDPYSEIRSTGSFILIDPISNATVAAGMIDRSVDPESSRPAIAVEGTTRVSGDDRRSRFGHGAAAIVVHSSNTAGLIERALFQDGWNAILVDTSTFTERELRSIARTLQIAGVAAIFTTTAIQHSPVLSELFGPALFEAPESSESDLVVATQVVDQLRAWRDAELRNQERHP